MDNDHSDIALGMIRVKSIDSPEVQKDVSVPFSFWKSLYKIFLFG